jgi:HAD superfamily hydrolase (TIGR01509 family)
MPHLARPGGEQSRPDRRDPPISSPFSSRSILARPRPRARAVLFDLGGVVIDWNPRHLYRLLFAEEAAMEAFLATVCNDEWNLWQDKGRPFAEGVEILARAYPHLAMEIGAYDTRWGEMLKGPIEESVALLAALRERGVPLFALSNWSAEKFPLARARFSFLEWFDGILVSGEVGLVKPDPRIFRLAAERFALEPQRTLFVDDSPRNIAAARRLGFGAHRFTAPAPLRRALFACGLLAP